MKWPIDTSAFSFMGSLPPEPVLDRQTQQQKVDVNGEPLYCMELMCFWEEGAEVLTVRFPGTPPVGLRQGLPQSLRPGGEAQKSWYGATGSIPTANGGRRTADLSELVLGLGMS